uniref:hypothetical protein n=1 Tax=Sulfolobus sp. NOB8H2 TaxID=84600 RepID=UPI0000062650|nr:hypothetical protein [Sulfolobus sp. NOB8H2]CAA09160.1 hypothetical protein [Sulfolobus sp. NOB8H2]
MEQPTLVIPDLADLVEKKQLMKEIYAPDGTLLFKPYDPWIESPLLVNRKKWRLFANYTPVADYPEERRAISKINTTGQIVEIRDTDLISMMGYVRRVHPGATVEEVVNQELARTVEETGEFKDDDEMGAYAMLLYISLAYAIHYGLLILVKD